MRDVILLAAIATSLLSGACTPSGSAHGSCGAGSTSTDATPFCYTLPSGFKQRGEPLKREGWVDQAFATEDKATLHFIVRDLDTFDKTWKALQGNAASSRATDVKEEEFAGGKGKLLTFTTPEKDPRFVVSAMLRGTKNTFECEGEYRMSAPKPEVLDACKSIREP